MREAEVETEVEAPRGLNLVVHIGQIGSFEGYSIEKLANRDGYTRKDVYGKAPDTVEDWVESFSPEGEILRPEIDVEAVTAKIKQMSPDVLIRASNKADRFVCEYLFYSSLAELRKTGDGEKRKVMFMHMPTKTFDADVQRGVDSTRGHRDRDSLHHFQSNIPQDCSQGQHTTIPFRLQTSQAFEMPPNPPNHWLARYANTYHPWTTTTTPNARKCFARPLGLVEYSFDTDGTEYGGRADMNSLLTLETSHTLPSKEDFRRRIALAWASLRLQHPMLTSRTVENAETLGRSFVVDVCESAEEVVQRTRGDVVWIEDYHQEVDGVELHRHCLNVARIIEPGKCMSRLHVLPLVRLPNGNYELRFLIVIAHQISDGLSAYNWYSHFIHILNTPQPTIEHDIEMFHQESEIKKRLPPAQEDLYPRVAPNKVRERWFWAIIRVLRHVRKTLPPTFPNPLKRKERLEEAAPFPPLFSKIFDYGEENRPPMNSGHVTAALSRTASARMLSLCRSINVSIGAGCFALAGLSMMELYEHQHPEIPDKNRLPFTAGFPLNPRPFFPTPVPTPAESCMLAFSEGIVMPFLPSSLPVEARFKLIARHANRELRMYQKRGREGTLDQHSPRRLLANMYLYQTERVESRLPVHRRMNVNPQGELPANVGKYAATCGVSSVGSTAAFFKPGTYSVDKREMEKAGKNFAADFRGLRTGVRAREGEFLIGSSTDAEGIVGFGVSYDANATSEEAADFWAQKSRSIDSPLAAPYSGTTVFVFLLFFFVNSAGAMSLTPQSVPQSSGKGALDVLVATVVARREVEISSQLQEPILFLYDSI
ncbi:hypothetical protein K458DRAFT_488355 [Lentithecium fluviatile CBS 122367]|uniref:Condensation domain-containing protein n=1 Tax=Lentithecium fluviatile CBS 122367 TaxID=1168545 RepID=A0A6G1IXE5_9PLEO|nr:hypothetical protein K458DRAFT_488355 [Lentithecium fluviatile CBS 122367]